MKTTRRKILAANLAALLAVGGVVGYSVQASASPSSVRALSTASASSTADSSATRVGAKTPELLLARLGKLIQAEDVDGIVALHEPEAALVDWDGSLIRGHKAIRKFYVAWFALDPVLTVNPLQTVIAGGTRGSDGKVHGRTASVMGTYTLEQTAADGTRESFSGNFCDIVQQQPDGSWLYINDNPYPPHGDSTGTTTAHH